MKKNDWKLICLILVVSVIGFFVFLIGRNQAVSEVVIKVDGEIYGTYSLDEDRTIKINDTNILEITSGYADMTSATCPDKVCVNQKKISKNHESLVCLPNKIIVEVSGGDESKMDAIAN